MLIRMFCAQRSSRATARSATTILMLLDPLATCSTTRSLEVRCHRGWVVEHLAGVESVPPCCAIIQSHGWYRFECRSSARDNSPCGPIGLARVHAAGRPEGAVYKLLCRMGGHELPGMCLPAPGPSLSTGLAAARWPAILVHSTTLHLHVQLELTSPAHQLHRRLWQCAVHSSAQPHTLCRVQAAREPRTEEARRRNVRGRAVGQERDLGRAPAAVGR